MFAEVILGNNLGRGSFCSVNEIRCINLRPACLNSPGSLTEEEMVDSLKNLIIEKRRKCYNSSKRVERISQIKEMNSKQMLKKEGWYNSNALSSVKSRKFMSEHCIKNGDSRYVLKRMSRGGFHNAVEDAITDLALEAKFLVVVQHPNIVKLRGISLESSCSPNFFLVLDRLYDTLDMRMKTWSAKKKRLNGLAGRFIDRDGLEKKNLWCERLRDGSRIAEAMRYLHTKK